MDDAQSLKPAFPSPTGTVLLLCLAFGTIGASFALDSSLNRAAGQDLFFLPLLASAIAAAAAGFGVIPWLQRLKAGQVIREDGPQAHLKKAGTPTMGGIFFVPAGVLVALLWSRFAPEVVVVAIATLAYGAIGWLDDWQILQKKSNKGISPRLKLGLQLGVGVLFCAWLAFTQPPEITNISLPFGLVLPLGILFWGLAIFVLAAESNATNLTDGVDGLAGGTCAIAFLGLGAIAAAEHPNLAIFCACLSGSCLGFVVHNRNPARVFMGDTGSLALGGALAATGILSQHLWELFILSGIFFAESLSVIAQVAYFKATKGPDGVGKRLFRMAPLHHHFELGGWTETQVVGAFYAIAALLAAVCWAIAA